MKRDDDRCDRCGHERWIHLDFHRKPRSCCAKDEGEQCQGFVEPERRWTLEEVKSAFHSFNVDADIPTSAKWAQLRAALEGK